MSITRPRPPIRLAALMIVALLPPLAAADILTSLTTHETPDGLAVTDITACGFYVQGKGLLMETGMIRIYTDRPSGPREVASASYSGALNEDGLVDATVGPITVHTSYVGLWAKTDYGDDTLWALTSAPFDVDCQPQTVQRPSCIAGPSSFLPPYGTPGHSKSDVGQRFKFGSTVPIKLTLMCPDGAPSEAPQIFVAKSMGAGFGAEQDGTTKSSSYSENILNKNGNHWQYNLDTSTMSKGVWQVRIHADGADTFGLLDLR